MRKLILSALLFITLSPAQGVVVRRRVFTATSLSIMQSCASNVYGTSRSCASTTNFTAGQTVWVLLFSKATDLSGTPGTSGAGCPSGWTAISGSAATHYFWVKGTAGTGPCTLTATATTANTIGIAWTLSSGGSATADGTGAFVYNAYCGSTTCSG